MREGNELCARKNDMSFLYIDIWISNKDGM